MKTATATSGDFPPGSYVILRNSHGVTIAHVEQRSSSGKVSVRKFVATTRQWTLPITIRAEDIVGDADAADNMRIYRTVQLAKRTPLRKPRAK